MTFHVCSSPAPTPVKPQPAPAILSQELVYTTSSISPLMSALTTPTNSNTREKKKKRNEQKETPTSDRKPNKGKEKDHLKKTSFRPLRQGQREGLIRRTREGGSEWEPIKILLEGDRYSNKMNTASNTRL
jgi:hypothetical protein